jgi:hypothetical protein
MAAFSTALQPIPADFENGLSAPGPRRVAVVPRYGLLAALVFLCLVPRVWMATKLASLCPDGVFYINLAHALEQGDIEKGSLLVRLNVYPPLLIGLNRLGLDWDVAGKYWGVLISSLVVLPLFGWVRRQFDDRIALVACLLYATHGSFIAWSPEAIRDPTYWFLFMSSLYLFWRAITEIRLVFFAAAGLVVALAMLTRFEGLFLLIPLTLWSFWRWRALVHGRRRLVIGGLLCVSVFPMLVLVANLVWFQYQNPLDAVRSRPFHTAKLWLMKSVAPSTTQAAVGETIDLALDMTFLRTVCLFFPAVTKGLAPAFALLMFGGIWRWRHVWLRRDQQPLFYASLVTAVSIWVHLSFARSSCPRYILPVALMGSPYAALGLLALTEQMGRWLDRWGNPRLRWGAAIPGLLVVFLGLSTALGDDCTNRVGEVRLGEWLQREIGPAPSLLGIDGLTPVVGYYAQGKCCVFPFWRTNEAVVQMVRDAQPDAVLMFEERWNSMVNGRTLLEEVEAQGYQRIDQQQLPKESWEIWVLVRKDKALRITARPVAANGRDDHHPPL